MNLPLIIPDNQITLLSGDVWIVYVIGIIIWILYNVFKEKDEKNVNYHLNYLNHHLRAAIGLWHLNYSLSYHI